jgi:cyclic pyranopterin phosphate synthase
MSEGDLARHGHRRLHVITSCQCNNNCLFCLDDRAERPQATVPDAFDQLRSHQRLGSVLFTCGEPTLHPELLRMVALARQLRYQEILVVTNGRRLAYAGYAERLVAVGVTGLTVSIHGPDPRSHDRLVRTPGAFEQTWRGLQNLARLRGAGEVPRLVTSSVVQKQNLDRLPDLLELLTGVRPDVSVLNVVQPLGLALDHYRATAVRYPALGRALLAALQGDRPRPAEVVIEGLPWCVTPDLRPWYGQREDIVMRHDQQDLDLVPTRGQVLGPPCEGCTVARLCGGVFEAYLARHGWGEFAPFPAR